MFALFLLTLAACRLSLVGGTGLPKAALYALSGGAFAITTALFALMLGVRRLPRRPAAISVTGAYALTVSLIAWSTASHAETDHSASLLGSITSARLYLMNLAVGSGGFWPALLGNTLGVAVFEEAAKLVPVLLLLRAGRLVGTRSAVMCAALAGLTFGLLESNWYAFSVYTEHPTPGYNYLIRFLILPAMHAIWPAVSIGLMLLAPSGAKRTGWRGIAWNLGPMAGVFLHGLYNALGAISPAAQIVAFMVTLLVLFAVARELA